MRTRYSWFLISFGTPMRMRSLVGGLEGAGVAHLVRREKPVLQIAQAPRRHDFVSKCGRCTDPLLPELRLKATDLAASAWVVAALRMGLGPVRRFSETLPNRRDS